MWKWARTYWKIKSPEWFHCNFLYQLRSARSIETSILVISPVRLKMDREISGFNSEPLIVFLLLFFKVVYISMNLFVGNSSEKSRKWLLWNNYIIRKEKPWRIYCWQYFFSRWFLLPDVKMIHLQLKRQLQDSYTQ